MVSMAQSQPSSDIYLVRFNPARSLLLPETAVNITSRAGYDNQPFFMPDGTLLYTSIRDDNQADAYHYNPKTKQTRRITNTPESEFSPTLMPDGKHISVIRQDAEGNQFLWQYDLKGKQGKAILKTVNNIGYHAWLSDHRLGLFIVGQPMTLQLVNVGEEKPKVVLNNVGRCLTTKPGTRTFTVVEKQEANRWVLMEIDSQSGEKKAIRPTLEGSEDYAWAPNGMLVMGQGTKVYRSTNLEESPWQPLADFSHLKKIRGINRMAVSPDGEWLAMVVAN